MQQTKNLKFKCIQIRGQTAYKIMVKNEAIIIIGTLLVFIIIDHSLLQKRKLVLFKTHLKRNVELYCFGSHFQSILKQCH